MAAGLAHSCVCFAFFFDIATEIETGFLVATLLV
jgi:hypothetical protein